MPLTVIVNASAESEAGQMPGDELLAAMCREPCLPMCAVRCGASFGCLRAGPSGSFAAASSGK